MTGIDEATARWLTSTEGLAVVARATEALDAGADPLQLSAHLGRDLPDPTRRAAALDAAGCRRRARARWPQADQLLFTRTSLEQASDPAVSAHRAGSLLARAAGEGSRWEGRVLDLGAGVGGDAVALARAAAPFDGEVLAVDTDAARLRLLAHNAEVAGVAITTHHADALEVASGPSVVCHADPGRRTGQRRVRRLTEHLPSVPALLAAHADACHLAVALSPGVEPEDPDLPPGLEVEYVQLGAGLMEATVWRSAVDRHRDAHRRATLLDRASGTEVARLPAYGAVTGDEELPVGDIGSWLVEVAPAAVRARQHDALGARIGARRVARTRALLTCDAAPPDAPWYRALPVLAVLPGRVKAVRRWLRSPDVAEHLDLVAAGVEIVLHGVDSDPTQLWQQLGRPTRGPQGVRLAFIRRDHDTVAVVCAAAHQARTGTL